MSGERWPPAILNFVLSYHERCRCHRELMALGLPVLVTRVGGLPENLEDGVEGWIVPIKKDPHMQS